MNSFTFIRPIEGSTLSDTQSNVDLALLPLIFCRLDEVFAQAGLRPDARIQFPCRNSVKCVVVLLFLLERGYSIAIHGADHDRRMDVDGRLGYCSVRLDITDCEDEINIQEPDRYIRIRKTTGSQVHGSNATIDVLTSGSSAQPKIVRHKRGKLIGNIAAFGARIHLTSADRIALPVPIYHMFGLGAALLPAMAAGASVDLQVNSNFLNFQERERRFLPTATFLTPAYCDQLTRLRRTAYRYKLVVLAGDLVTRETFENSEKLLGTTVKLYGSTELGAAVAGDRTEPLAVRSESIGLPLDGVRLRISSGQTAAAAHASGTLSCQHDNSFEGYVASDGTLDKDSLRQKETWYQTGDSARVDHFGRLSVLGRSDRQVKRDGHLISLDDLQAKISKWPEIEAVGVVESGWSKRGVGLLALCVLKKGCALDLAQFRERGIRELGRAAVPDKIAFSDRLPMLQNGKLDLNGLRVSHADISEERIAD